MEEFQKYVFKPKIDFRYRFNFEGENDGIVSQPYSVLKKRCSGA